MIDTYSVLDAEKNQIGPRTTYDKALDKYLKLRGLGECVWLVRWLSADTYVVIPVSDPEPVERWD